MRWKIFILILLIFISNGKLFSGDNLSSYEDKIIPGIEVHLPEIILSDISSEISIVITDSTLLNANSHIHIQVNGRKVVSLLKDDKLIFTHVFKAKGLLKIKIDTYSFEKEVTPIPLWLSILPPLIAILSALIFREVFSAIFSGIFFGAVVIYYFQGNIFFVALFKGLFAVVDTYILTSLTDEGHLSIIVFSMLIGAMVSLISRNGGMSGIVNYLSKYAASPRSGQFFTWLMGILIFFDDYANTLVVGNTMRPVTDRLKISREKLSYIVDSTAAPVAAIALVTTWIGAELSYIQDSITTIGLTESPYHVFINSLAYSFYPILTLGFVLILIWQKRDYGPMYKAEVKARNGQIVGVSASNKLDDFNVNSSVNAHPINAIIPVGVVVIGTITGLFYTGFEVKGWDDSLIPSQNISLIIGAADSYKALLWSSISGVIVAVMMTVSQCLLSLKDSVESLMSGFKIMLTAIIILTLAWSLALVTEHLHTADFITQILIIVKISPYLVPALSFILAALIAFSTGAYQLSW